MGSVESHTNVVWPFLVVCDSNWPLPTAVMPSGTVAWKVNVALSVGWSLDGSHAGAPCGSPGTNAPSSVGTQPSMESSGSVMTGGVPAYFTTTVKDVRSLSF